MLLRYCLDALTNHQKAEGRPFDCAGCHDAASQDPLGSAAGRELEAGGHLRLQGGVSGVRGGLASASESAAHLRWPVKIVFL